MEQHIWKVYHNGMQIGYHYSESDAEEQANTYIQNGCKVDREADTYPNGITVHSIYMNEQR